MTCEYCDAKGMQCLSYSESSMYFIGPLAATIIIKTNSQEELNRGKHLTLRAKPNTYYLSVEAGEEIDINIINYCPVCGRKLNE